jgi:hypothetical protein
LARHHNVHHQPDGLWRPLSFGESMQNPVARPRLYVVPRPNSKVLHTIQQSQSPHFGRKSLSTSTPSLMRTRLRIQPRLSTTHSASVSDPMQTRRPIMRSLVIRTIVILLQLILLAVAVTSSGDSSRGSSNEGGRLRRLPAIEFLFPPARDLPDPGTNG